MPKPLHIAIDGNEANVSQRVGSNVYAFEVLKQLFEQTQRHSWLTCTVLLAQPPVVDFPQEQNNWRYRVLQPRPLWTQWALPLHLFWHQKTYQVLFTPGHYAPRFSTVPYVSSVMDLAFLRFPEQFRKNDAFQLKHWTRYSVQKAQKIITISEFSKKSIRETYGRKPSDIVVAPPAAALAPRYSPLRFGAFVRKHDLTEGNYFLYIGTVQPRKNLENLIEAFEIFCRSHAAAQLKKKGAARKKQQETEPQLVIAGKIGWLADSVQERWQRSSVQKQIILTGFVSEDLKRPLYEHARATTLVGLYEGFGIPPLESLSVGTVPIVSNTSSLPEVIGNAGFTVDPTDPHDIAEALKQAWNLPQHRRKQLQSRAKKQTARFTWQKTGQIIFKTLKKVAHDSRK